LAGTTLALFDNASVYGPVTQVLAAALDDSFARDPVFAPPAPFFMLINEARRPVGKAYSRTPTFPTFPLAREIDLKRPTRGRVRAQVA
jgi:hypothetical protein